MHKFCNLCDLARSSLHLIFWTPVFSPARVVTAIENQPVCNTDRVIL